MKIFVAKRAEVTVSWRKVDNEKPDNLYSLSNIRHSRMMTCMGDQRNACMILVGKHNRKVMLGEYIERGFSKNRTGMDWI